MVNSTVRLPYPDVCRFVAIFAITWAHCAQYISGLNWTHFLGGSGIVHAFSMPMFFLLSGWFINPEKLRETNVCTYFVAKFKRLIIPAYAWTIVYCIMTLSVPGVSLVIFFNWYVKALFVCLIILIISTKWIKNDVACAVVSSLLLLVCPMSDMININFMYPFIWGGHFLRKYLEGHYNHQSLAMLGCLVIGIALLFDWTTDKTMYVTPFKIMSLNPFMVYAYLYRTVLGFTLSAAIIYGIMRTADMKFLKLLAKYGYWSLVIYLFSFVFNGVLALVLDRFDLHTNEYVVLDILSFITCVVIIILSVLISNYCKKNKWTSLLFLGES
jgi:fucose 4-O-acetylase-like acetyltransferase